MSFRHPACCALLGVSVERPVCALGECSVCATSSVTHGGSGVAVREVAESPVCVPSCSPISGVPFIVYGFFIFIF